MELAGTERETLKAMYRLSPGGDAVRTGDLAEALGVSPATVTSRLKRFNGQGLAEHTPYQGVRLTSSGRRLAVSAIRRHRIVERFLSDMLGYPWDGADRLAVTFEHALPDEVVGRLFAALRRPTTCPHGFPIPEDEAEEVDQLPTLADIDLGREVEVALPGTTHSDVVAFLDTLGIRPGARVTVRERQPFEGPVVVDVDGHERLIGNTLAREIYVSAVTRKAM
ncbi:MAG TPA: metal-dependent transcriptional regulator [Acidimicrobiia bacterium]|nr:metal-dependent transcriptional regulator [Acidimicrobiia bacterium]